MRKIVLAALALCVLLLPCIARGEENLLRNGGFEETLDGRPLGWEEDMWLFDEGVSYLELREGGRDGGLCVMVENAYSNDARFVQWVEVEPETLYRLSGWVKAEGCDPAFAGASLSVIASYNIFPDVYDTNGEWVELVSYILTDVGQTELLVGARLGDYAADNVGKAWFDDLSLVRTETFPLGEEVIRLREYADNSQWLPEPEATAPASSPSPIAGVALFAILLALLKVLRVRGLPFLPKEGELEPGGGGRRGAFSSRAAICLTLAAAAAVRLYLMATQPGYPTDMNCFFSWARRMAEVGPNAFYSSEMFCDYPPGYLYFLWFTGGLMKLLGVTDLDALGRLVVKLVPMLADLGAVFLLWKLGKKRLGDLSSLLLALLYALSPAVLMDGAIWGQVDGVLALGLVVTVALAMENRWVLALPAFAVTVLIKPQALIAAPAGLAALVLALAHKETRRKTAREAATGLGVSLAVAAALLLPFVWGKEQPFSWLWERYAISLEAYNFATLNTANFYYLLGGNWVPLDDVLGTATVGAWGTALTVLALALVTAAYLWRRDREKLPLYCALLYMGMYLFGVKMHERYLFPALLLLLYAYIRKPDKRLLYLFAGFSATLYMNCALVLRDTHLALGFGFAGCALAVANLALFSAGMWTLMDRKALPLPPRQPFAPPPVNRLDRLSGKTPPAFSLRQADWISMLGLTLVYAIVAYVGLGSTVAPQTVWKSTGQAESVTVDLGSVKEFNVLYYPGINQRDNIITFAFSADGEGWYDASPAKVYRGDCFAWRYLTQAVYDEAGEAADWTDAPLICGARYVRVTVEGPPVTVMEVAFRSLSGDTLPVLGIAAEGAREENAFDPALLFDEPETAPEQPSYYNSTYFDEIYHARTGYEHAHGLQTYETTHPPLGKIFIALGIRLFGMTAFGWRFMGVLAGVLMVPAMYLLGKLLFKRTRLAFLAAFVMAFDMMHLTQTRIATIDSYAVLFIILMYLCMFRYLQMSVFRDGWRTLIPLGLSGLFMGLGCASKWICLYAGVGLAVLFAWSVARQALEWRAGLLAGGEHAERVLKFPRYLVGTLAACLGFFVVIPFGIYYASYIPYFAWEGGLTLDKFLSAQTSMYNYHATLMDDHAFKSPWYEWPLMLKPMFYYNGRAYAPEGMISTIMCMGNPAVWYAGLAALVYGVYGWLRPYLRGERAADHRPAMLLLAFAAQFVPWMLVPRSMFIYHYFGSLPFVMLFIAYAFERLGQRRPESAGRAQALYMALVLALFVGFYPIATGVQVPQAWGEAMNWFSFLRLPGWRYKGWLYF